MIVLSIAIQQSVYLIEMSTSAYRAGVSDALDEYLGQTTITNIPARPTPVRRGTSIGVSQIKALLQKKNFPAYLKIVGRGYTYSSGRGRGVKPAVVPNVTLRGRTKEGEQKNVTVLVPGHGSGSTGVGGNTAIDFTMSYGKSLNAVPTFYQSRKTGRLLLQGTRRLGKGNGLGRYSRSNHG